jgi:hypothetical protein
VRAGYGAHEQDDRHHHQTRRDDCGGQADLALCVQHAAAGGDQDNVPSSSPNSLR